MYLNLKQKLRRKKSNQKEQTALEGSILYQKNQPWRLLCSVMFVVFPSNGKIKKQSIKGMQKNARYFPSLKQRLEQGVVAHILAFGTLGQEEH